MKNKKITYLLLLVVVVVWGLIIRKVFTITAAESTVPTAILPRAKPEVKKADRELLLDYRDPFLGRVNRELAAKTPPAALSAVKLPVAMPMVVEAPPALKYKGIIRKGKQIYAVIESGKMQEVVLKGGIIDDFRLLSITADSVVMQKGSKRYTFKLQ